MQPYYFIDLPAQAVSFDGGRFKRGTDDDAESADGMAGFEGGDETNREAVIAQPLAFLEKVVDSLPRQPESARNHVKL